MSEPLDIDLLVSTVILERYPTPVVEKNLDPSATLAGDLGLTRDQIIFLGLAVEVELQYRGLPSFTDAQILSWVTVQDIIDTVTEIVI